MSEFWIPIILFICIFGIVAVLLFFNSKREESRQATIRAAIERGQELTEEVVKSLTPPKSNNFGLAFGLPIVGLGIALLIFGMGIGESEAAWASVFPFFFGMGFVVFWFIEQKER
jgi:Domain of unknown function (DUF6249)